MLMIKVEILNKKQPYWKSPFSQIDPFWHSSTDFSQMQQVSFLIPLTKAPRNSYMNLRKLFIDHTVFFILCYWLVGLPNTLLMDFKSLVWPVFFLLPRVYWENVKGFMHVLGARKTTSRYFMQVFEGSCSCFLQKMDLLAAINDYNNALKNKHFIACLWN